MQLSALMKIFSGLGKSLNDFLKIATNTRDNFSSTTNMMSILELQDQVRNQVKAKNGNEIERSLDSEDIDRIIKILIRCKIPSKRNEIIKAIGLSFKTEKLTRLFKLLQQNDWITMQYPESPNSPKQQYITTKEGLRISKLG